MQPIVIPRISRYEESCILRQWLVPDAGLVQLNAVVAVLETGKATFELQASGAGVMHQRAETGSECPVGSTIALLFENESARQEFLSQHARPQGLDQREPAPRALLDRRQAAVARTVTLSHATIPSAFLALRIWCDRILEHLTEVRRSSGVFVDVPEFLIKVLGGLRSTFPAFFGHPDAASTLDERTNVGVTLDVGSGLAIPVLKGVDEKSLLEVAQDLMRLRELAVEDRNDERVLSGGQISVSLNMERDCVLSIPIIFPGQTSMLSVTGLQTDLALNKDGVVLARRYLNLGVAYDHRYINGYDAMRFLQAIKERVESPARKA
jgi:2-oxoglutarate dehydrogenase E2 component (dihydrolipoamide succinyltransferase)